LAAAGAVAAMSLDLRSVPLVLVSGSLALTVLVLLLATLSLGRPGWIGAIIGLLALLFFAHILVAGETNTGLAAAVGVALLLVGELTQLSLDSRLAGRYEASLSVARAIAIAWLGLLGLGVALLGMLAAGVPIPGGIGAVAVGMGASVGLLGLFSVVAARVPARSADRDAP
jgi:hypothetical protein